MKFLALLVLALVGVWFFRNRQAQVRRDSTEPKPHLPQHMVQCAQCGIHLPANEVVKGAQGNYCCQDHLHQSEP